MVQSCIYDCIRCGYKSDRLSSLKNHLNKMNLCNPILTSATREDAIAHLENIKKNYNCDFCGATFETSAKKCKHKFRCKHNPKNNNCVSENVINSNNNTNSHNTINYNININNSPINIRNFGDENKEYISTDMMRYIIMDLNLFELFKQLHCDPEFPENHNVRIKSVKRERMEIYQEDKWNAHCYNDGIKKILNQLLTIVSDFSREHRDLIEEDMSEDEIEETMRNLMKLRAWVNDNYSTFIKLREAKLISEQILASIEP